MATTTRLPWGPSRCSRAAPTLAVSHFPGIQVTGSGNHTEPRAAPCSLRGLPVLPAPLLPSRVTALGSAELDEGVQGEKHNPLLLFKMETTQDTTTDGVDSAGGSVWP